MTVADRFQTLLNQIAVPQREQDDYATHQYGVRQAMANEYPGSECHTIGSHARGSAIGGTSDLDTLARLPLDAVRRSATDNTLISSNTALTNVRQPLLSRYPTTVIGRDGQAVVVSFASGTRDIDVVPAAWAGMIDVAALKAKRPAYWIPDGEGGWMKTAPQAHNDYIANADAAAGGKLRRVAQLLRHWRRARTPKVPMLTFHAELVLANNGTCVGPMSYAQALARSFAVLAARNGAALQDPLGISGYIQIGSTPTKRSEIVSALSYAADLAARAVDLDTRGSMPEAYALWARVFNADFPTR